MNAGTICLYGVGVKGLVGEHKGPTLLSQVKCNVIGWR
jgi:hypothetical protein